MTSFNLELGVLPVRPKSAFERGVAGVAILAALALTACTSSSDGGSAFATTAGTSITTSTVEIEDKRLMSQSGGADVRAVAVGPSGLVAVGHDPRQRDINEDDEAAVWFSSDGSEWTRVDTDPSFIDSSMSDVVWYQLQELYVAVGHHVSEGAIWVSEDGRSWSRVALLPFSNPPGGIEVDAVVVTAVPDLLALGREWLSEGEAIPAEWSSHDGENWERLNLDDGP